MAAPEMSDIQESMVPDEKQATWAQCLQAHACHQPSSSHSCPALCAHQTDVVAPTCQASSSIAGMSAGRKAASVKMMRHTSASRPAHKQSVSPYRRLLLHTPVLPSTHFLCCMGTMA